MRYRSSYGNVVLPLLIAGLAVVALLPGGDAPATSGSTPAQAAVLSTAPTPEPIAVARVGNAMLSPIPLTEAMPATPMAAVPDATAKLTPVPPAVETTASIGDEPGATPPVGTGKSTFVGGSAVNMRAGPSKSTATVTVLQPGEPLQVMEESDGWTYVATLAGETGWVSSRFLGNSAPAPKATAAPKSEERSASTGTTIRARGAVTVRSGPSMMSERLFVVEPGERIQIAETRGSWARVILESGISGWVRVRRND